LLILRNCLFVFILRTFCHVTTQKSLMRLVGDLDKSKQKCGSRNSDGNVPNSNWNDGQAKLNWYNTGNRNEDLCGREEVFHNKEPLRLLLCQRAQPIIDLFGNSHRLFR
jgi:hypothetical protein